MAIPTFGPWRVEDTLFYATLAVFGWAALGGGIRALTMPAPAPLQLDEGPERFVAILMPAPQLEVEPVPVPRAREEREAVEGSQGLGLCMHFRKTGRPSHGGQVQDLFGGRDIIGHDLDAALASIGDLDPEEEHNDAGPQSTDDPPAPDRTGPPRGHVSIGEPTLDLTAGEPAMVTRTLRKYTGQVKYCYERRLQADPSLAGTLWLSWTIHEGRSQAVVLDSNSTGSEELAACILGKVRTWRYPAEVDGEVSGSWVLEPEGPTR